MPRGAIINGVETLISGVYVIAGNADYTPLPTGQGSVCVIGPFPVLEPARVYRSTSRSALEELIAPGEDSILTVAKLAYESSLDSEQGGAPAAVDLISTVPSTQAFGILPLAHLASESRPKAKSRIWGPRGNTTQMLISPRPGLGGFEVGISNRGTSQPVDVPAADGVVQIGYEYTMPPAPSADTGYGFADDGDGDGIVSASVTGDFGLRVQFLRTLTDATVNNGKPSWYPDGPVTGAVTVSVLVGSELTTATAMTFELVGLDEDGVPHTETITIAPDDIPNLEWDTSVSATSATQWTQLESVTAATNVAGSFAGSFTVSGYNFKSQSMSQSNPSCADVIAEISGLGGGFQAATQVGNPSSFPAAALDLQAVTELPVALSAQMYAIVTAVNTQSQYVDFDMTGRSYARPVLPFDAATTYDLGDLVEDGGIWYRALRSTVDDTPSESPLDWEVYAGMPVSFIGGSVGVQTLGTWQACYDELLYHKADIKVPQTDDTDKLQAFLRHINDCWGEYQNFCMGAIGVGSMASFATLRNLAALYNSDRIHRVFDRPTVVAPRGNTVQMEPWALALQLASAQNGKRRRQLDGWRPNVLRLDRNAAITGPRFYNDLIRLGYCVFGRSTDDPYQLLNELTGWLGDNNPVRTSGASQRSRCDVHTYTKAYMDDAVRAADGVDGLSGSMEGLLEQALQALVDNGTIVRYWGIKIWEEDRFINAEFYYQPVGTKNQIVITAKSSLAQANTATSQAAA